MYSGIKEKQALCLLFYFGVVFESHHRRRRSPSLYAREAFL